jgi:hypothetical protein
MNKKSGLVFCFIFFCFFMHGHCATEDMEEKPVSLLSRFYAVHAMRKLPMDGMLKAGIVSNGLVEVPGVSVEKGGPVPGLAGWRPTLHFSLGKLADDIPGCGLIISDRDYVLVLPLSNLLDQLIGVSVEDTVTLGDFPIPEGSILLVTSTKEREVRSHAWTATMEIVTRASSHKLPMSDHVLNQIRKKGGFLAPTAGGAIAALCEQFSQEALIATIRQVKPFVFFGEHQHHPVGRIEAGRASALYPLVKRKLISREMKLDYFDKHFGPYKPVFDAICERDEEFSKILSVNDAKLHDVWKYYWNKLQELAQEDFEKGVPYIAEQYTATQDYNARLINSALRGK